MHRSELDRLLTRLNVRLEAVAVCDIGSGMTLEFEPFPYIVVHHVVRGGGILEVRGSPPIAFNTDSMLLIPPDRTKRITAGSPPSVRVRTADHCSAGSGKLMRLDATDGGDAELIIVCGAIHATCGSFGPFDDLPAPLVEDMAAVASIRMAFRTMLMEHAHPDLCSSALTESLMKQCLLLFIRRHLTTHGISSLSLALNDERLARALNSILDRPRDLLRMRDLAASAGMSRSAFAKLFVETLHTTPMEFVRQTRLQRAAELLESTDLPVKTIAGEIGYASRSQFCRAFRAAFSTDPSDYRKRGGRHSPRTAASSRRPPPVPIFSTHPQTTASKNA
ncbi:MAG: helix-turn-helix domain-containing protein [Steroidobacter sp.]